MTNSHKSSKTKNSLSKIDTNPFEQHNNLDMKSFNKDSNGHTVDDHLKNKTSGSGLSSLGDLPPLNGSQNQNKSTIHISISYSFKIHVISNLIILRAD